MVRMPDEKSKNPLTKLSSILKKNPSRSSETDCDESENKRDAQREEEKVKEIIRRQVVKH